MLDLPNILVNKPQGLGSVTSSGLQGAKRLKDSSEPDTIY